MLTLSVIFAVVLGKEAFGGTGMNVVNVALLARVFIFFAYPSEISGDGPWIAGLAMNGDAGVAEYHFGHTLFNPIFNALGWSVFEPGLPTVAGFSSATPLSVASAEGWAQYNAYGELVGGLTQQYSNLQMFIGGIPGCIGETSKPLIILGGIFLMVTGVASWRIIAGMTLGVVLTGMLFNLFPLANFPQMNVPFYVHFFMGGLLFAMVFMATDPVTAASTNTGKWIYGFMIGFIGLVIRVLNLAYAEGWMLAILFMNVFAPLIDYYVLEFNISKRLKRAQYAKQ
jgi:Na+-transporting NADH:ubiquinone oxidoreductase subunit B